MVETNRLRIIPLIYCDLILYLRGNGEFEKEFNLTQNGRTVSLEIKERVTRTILPKMNDLMAHEYLFYTFWIVIEKSSDTIVGELGFKGGPNEKGEIEIGYGTMYKQRDQGFMTEAVGGMVHWAKEQPAVTCILAETDLHNIASIKVLQKNHFQFDHQKEKMKWWKIAVN